MYRHLDGPAKQYLLSSVGTSTPVRVKDGGNPEFSDRKVVTLQADGKFYVYFTDEGVTPNAATVLANGFLQFKDSINTYEAGPAQVLYVLADSGTVNIRVAERG